MTTVPGRLPAAAFGAALATLVPVPALAWILARNPWFLDTPALWVAVVDLPCVLVGALVGLALRRRLGRVRRLGALATLAAAVALGPALGAVWPHPGQVPGLRLLVVGVDGATFDVLDADPATFPAFSALQEGGVRADLLATEPMFSPLLWATLSTGKTPEQHGIHGFQVHSTDCRVARFWEIMEAAGLSTGIYKWLVSYPPQKLSAFQVPAWLAPDIETWPADLSFVKELELSRRLKRRQVQARRGDLELAWEGVRHGFRLSTLAAALRYALAERLLPPSPERAHRDGQLLRVLMDRDVFVWTLHAHPAEVATFTDYATDAIGHRFWKYHQPELFPEVTPDEVARWGDSLLMAYRQADAVLGELAALCPPEARLVVVSDHGFQALQGGDSGLFFVPRTERLRALVEARVGRAEVARLGRKLVVTLEGGDTAGLEAMLGTLTQASTGEPFFRWEPVAGDPRSLALTLRDERVPRERLEHDTVGGEPLMGFVAPGETFSGVHEARGVFLAAGPGIGRGVRIDALSQLDLTPILLALVGIPAAQDMAGAVPAALFETPPALGPGPVTYDDLVVRREVVGGTEGVNEEQLKALGYIE